MILTVLRILPCCLRVDSLMTLGGVSCLSGCCIPSLLPLDSVTFSTTPVIAANSQGWSDYQILTSRKTLINHIPKYCNVHHAVHTPNMPRYVKMCQVTLPDTISNRNAFQSKTHLPLTNRKSITYNVTLTFG